MICNKKTLDPRDPESPAVLQLEIAMGAGIECFKGAMAVNVPRSRFFPVKTCSDLFLLRSDAIECDSDGRISLAPSLNGRTPIVDLDPQQYKLFDSLDALGMPSLKEVEKLVVRGKVHFKTGAALKGEVVIENDADETVVIE